MQTEAERGKHDGKVPDSNLIHPKIGLVKLPRVGEGKGVHWGRGRGTLLVFGLIWLVRE